MLDADAPCVAVISYACFARSAPGGMHENDRLGPGENLASKQREAPAVVGPRLSCRSVTTILADRDVVP